MNYSYNDGDWAIIKIGKYVSLVCFQGVEKRFYWGQNRSWSVLTDKDKILEYIGQVKRSHWNKMEIDFYKKYHSPKEGKLEQSCGWISPNGEWFTCSSSGHMGLAKLLCACFYNDIDNGEYFLEEKLWIKVYFDGLFAFKRDYPYPIEFMTDEQKEMVAKLSSVGNDKWNYRMKKYLGIDVYNSELEFDL